MRKSPKFSPEVVERAARRVFEAKDQPEVGTPLLVVVFPLGTARRRRTPFAVRGC